MSDPIKFFHAQKYLNIKEARLTHLTSLGLNIENKTILELGAGVGDLSPFFMDHAKKMTIVEGRREKRRENQKNATPKSSTQM